MFRLLVVFGLFGLIASSCGTTDKSVTMGEKNASEESVYSGQIVEKAFVKKNGSESKMTELYFRASVQDYFIKICESRVSYNDLKPYVGEISGVTVEAEIREGEWDICENDPVEMQSRVGNYIIIKNILK